MHLAMLHLARTEDRIKLLFADLAESFGRVTTDGILIDLNLTHETIGGLVGSRRPSVSLALHTLASEGLLIRLDHAHWKLATSAITQ
jgi:CRP-like cAMP-binding protein